MAPEEADPECVKQAMAIIATQIQTHERYHTQKENSTWLATAAYLGGTIVLVGHDPFWSDWPLPWFIAWLILLTATSATVLIFLDSQFKARHIASAFFLAANNVATRWVSKQPKLEDLRSQSVRELDNMSVFAAVEKEFGEIFHGKSSTAQRVAFLLVIMWSVACIAYLLASYCA